MNIMANFKYDKTCIVFVTVSHSELDVPVVVFLFPGKRMPCLISRYMGKNFIKYFLSCLNFGQQMFVLF